MSTMYYIVPEIVKKNYGFKYDIRFCGIILYVLLYGYPPCNGSTEQRIIKRILEGKVVLNKNDSDLYPQMSKNLFSMMFTYNSEDHPIVEKVLQQPQFEKVYISISISQQLYSYLTDQRTSRPSKRCKRHICLYFVNFFELAKDKEQFLKTFNQMDVDLNGTLSPRRTDRSILYDMRECIC